MFETEEGLREEVGGGEVGRGRCVALAFNAFDAPDAFDALRLVSFFFSSAASRRSLSSICLKSASLLLAWSFFSVSLSAVTTLPARFIKE